MFSDMIGEMRGCVSGYSALLARTHLNEAWADIRNMRGWSFQLCNGGFGTPAVVNTGQVSVALGGTTVTANSAAAAVWATASNPISFLTNRQFRVGASTIYNIIAYNQAAGTITLDRQFFDTTYGSGLGYSIYQCYYPVPVQDFEAWESVLDVNNVIYLDTTSGKKAREFADRNDPQRQIFSLPGSMLPYQVDSRTGSSTLGWMMYEMYPQPQNQYAYQTWYSRLGANLVLPTDTLPFPMTEDAVKAGARVKAYEWLIARTQALHPDANVQGLQFTVGLAKTQYDAKLKEIRSMDRDRVDLWNYQMSRLGGRAFPATFNPQTGQVSSRNI